MIKGRFKKEDYKKGEGIYGWKNLVFIEIRGFY
jgi:hypothetical protein